jgi:hypothetical protein
MRTWLAVLLGILAVIVVSAAIGGRDNTGETVRATTWAGHTCGTVGAWEGQLEAIGDELELSNVGARRNDGGSGDHVEGTVYVRSVLDRVIEATDETLQRGLQQAGVPDVAQGAQASLVLRNWAQETENDLYSARRVLREADNTTTAAFAALGRVVGALEDAAVRGRAAVRQVEELDPALADAFDGARECRELMREEP